MMRDDMSVRERLRGSICTVHVDHPIAIVGEAPGPRTRADMPFYPYPPNSAAGRLLRYLGWSRSRYLLTFARRNLLDEWPGPTFPVAKARHCVPHLVSGLHPRPMLLMGKGVSAAFGVTGLDPLQLTTVRVPHADLGHVDAQVAIVPHTSGRNLWYNDPTNQRAVREFVESIAGEDPCIPTTHPFPPTPPQTLEMPAAV